MPMTRCRSTNSVRICTASSTGLLTTMNNARGSRAAHSWAICRKIGRLTNAKSRRVPFSLEFVSPAATTTISASNSSMSGTTGIWTRSSSKASRRSTCTGVNRRSIECAPWPTNIRQSCGSSSPDLKMCTASVLPTTPDGAGYRSAAPPSAKAAPCGARARRRRRRECDGG